MFGFAFGSTLFFVLLVLLKIADKVGVCPVAPDATLAFIVILVSSMIVGIMAQIGLKHAIQKHSKH